MAEGGISRRQLSQLRAGLAKRDLKPRQRQRLLYRMAKQGIIAAAKRNQRNQTDPDGTSWAPRKRGNKKLLRGLPRLLAVREMPEREAVVIYLRGKGGMKMSAGVLGNIHTQGTSIKVRAEDRPRPAQTGPATRKQAVRLRKLGYKRRDGEREVRASASWIKDNISQAQAGLLIRKLSGEPARKVWMIEIPARAFLGVSDEEFNKILARQLQAIDFGWNVKAQDIKGNKQ